MQSSLFLVCLLPDSHESYHISLQLFLFLPTPASLSFLDMAFSIQSHPLPFRCTSAPALSSSPYSSTLCLSPRLPCPLLISLACMCVCVSPRPYSLPAFLLSSRYVCCTAPRRRLSWSSELPGPLVRPEPRTCGLLWGQLSQVWAWKTCPGLCLPCGPRAGGTNLAGGLLGVCLC